jgi:Tfp pilus assembly protein PilV
VIASTVLGIGALGVLNYQYYAVSHAKRAQTEVKASKIGQLILEDWKATGGSTGFDPSQLQMGITRDVDEYKVTMDDVTFFLKLSSKDQAHDLVSRTTIRQINVMVKWRKDYADVPVNSDYLSYSMSTYVRVDQSGG